MANPLHMYVICLNVLSSEFTHRGLHWFRWYLSTWRLISHLKSWYDYLSSQCIKCIKDQQTYFNFIDVIWLQSDHQHVLATHVAIFRVIFFENKATTSPSNLLYNSTYVSAMYFTPHTSNNFNFRYCLVINILFYCSTANINQKLYDF